MGIPWTTLGFLALAILLPSPFLFPSFCYHAIILLDFFTPFSAFDSPLVQSYHKFLVDRLPEIPEKSPIILSAEGLTREKLRVVSKDYTVPVVIRGLAKDAPAIEKWKNASWWKENYGDEKVLCKYVETIATKREDPECTITGSLGSANKTGRTYITGESRIFARRPELAEMVDSAAVNAVAPGSPVFMQLFLGYRGTGSDIHSAMGTNLFRQVTGRKRWWLIPQSQTPYVFASLNPNGFSSHTKTNIGKYPDPESPWLKKIERYTVMMYPGDVLLNPPWIWHGILNEADSDDELIIGVPTRYSVKYALPALKNNWLLTLIGLGSISKTYGLQKFLSDPANLQNGIERARLARAKQMIMMNEKEEEVERAL